MPHAPCSMSYAPCSMPHAHAHAPCPMPHAPCPMPVPLPLGGGEGGRAGQGRERERERKRERLYNSLCTVCSYPSLFSPCPGLDLGLGLGPENPSAEEIYNGGQWSVGVSYCITVPTYHEKDAPFSALL